MTSLYVERLGCWIGVALIWTLAAPLVPAALAHDGALDARGWHQECKLAVHNCHEGVLVGRSFPSETEAMKARAGSLPASGERVKALPLRSGREREGAASAVRRQP